MPVSKLIAASRGSACDSMASCRIVRLTVFCTLCVAYAGMLCDIGKMEGRTCILRSPVINDTFRWSCMGVVYELSSHDIKLKLDILADEKSLVSYILSANKSAIWIPNPDEGSSISVEFRASRYLVSAEDYVYAVVSSVDFLRVPCATDTDSGKFQCVYTSYVLVDYLTTVTHEYDLIHVLCVRLKP